MNYKIKFKIGEKKMLTRIKANNEDDAEYKLRGKIEILSIEEERPDNSNGNDPVDGLKNMFGIK